MSWLFLKRTCEDERGTDPLPLRERVAEDDDGGQHGEELPGGGDDGAGQRPEVAHAHEDEILKDEEGWILAGLNKEQTHS